MTNQQGPSADIKGVTGGWRLRHPFARLATIGLPFWRMDVALRLIYAMQACLDCASAAVPGPSCDEYLTTFGHMIQLNNVFKFYRTEGHTRIVLDHVSMVFDSTRSYGLIGVNGSGKSTTLRLIAGTELPNSGSVRRSVRVSWPLGLAAGSIL